MKRVLCLYRVSTKKQLDPSSDKTKADIPLQRKACKEFIEQDTWCQPDAAAHAYYEKGHALYQKLYQKLKDCYEDLAAL